MTLFQTKGSNLSFSFTWSCILAKGLQGKVESVYHEERVKRPTFNTYLNSDKPQHNVQEESIYACGFYKMSYSCWKQTLFKGITLTSSSDLFVITVIVIKRCHQLLKKSCSVFHTPQTSDKNGRSQRQSYGVYHGPKSLLCRVEINPIDNIILYNIIL